MKKDERSARKIWISPKISEISLEVEDDVLDACNIPSNNASKAGGGDLGCKNIKVACPH